LRKKLHQAARVLPKMWGARLLYLTEADITTLNCTLTQRPDGHPFKINVHPRPIPKKGAPRLLERIVEQGHWPDTESYLENDRDGEFNLLHRVSEHLPGSEEWLLSSLKSTFDRKACDVIKVQGDIVKLLRNAGLMRLDPRSSSLLVDFCERLTEFTLDDLFVSQWDAMANAGQPALVALLMLLCQEALHFRQIDIANRLGRRCVRGWTVLLRRPEFSWNTKAKEIRREAIDAARSTLEFVHYYQRSITPASDVRPSTFPFCAICKPTPVGMEASNLLNERYEEIFAKIAYTRNKVGALPVYDLESSSIDAIAKLASDVAETISVFREWENATARHR